MSFSLDALEYYRLKELLGRYVSSVAARHALDELEPIVDAEKLESEHAITSEAMQYLREHRVPFNDIALLPEAIEKLTVEGIVHGTSSSGATVFMEPLAVLEMNNELVRLQDEEHAEIARILAELTDLIQSSSGLIGAAQLLSAYLEMVFGKARFGRDF